MRSGNGEEKEPKNRTVDNDLYLGMLKDLLAEGKSVSLVISGGSMTPFVVHARDSVFLEPAPPDVGRTSAASADRAKTSRESVKLKRGDVVFYQRDNGMYVLHRIVRIAPDGSYVLCGDAQTILESGVCREQIFARAAAVRRKGKVKKPGSLYWFFFAQIWSRIIPFRRQILHVYTLIHRGLGG